MVEQSVTIKGIMIAALIFTLVIVGGTTILSFYVNEDYSHINQGNLSDFNQTFNKLSKIKTNTEQLNASVRANEQQNPIYSLFDLIFNKASSIMKGIGDSLTFMNDFFKGLMKSYFGIPPFVVTILELLLLVVIIFSFLRLVFQREP